MLINWVDDGCMKTGDGKEEGGTVFNAVYSWKFLFRMKWICVKITQSHTCIVTADYNIL